MFSRRIVGQDYVLQRYFDGFDSRVGAIEVQRLVIGEISPPGGNVIPSRLVPNPVLNRPARPVTLSNRNINVKIPDISIMTSTLGSMPCQGPSPPSHLRVCDPVLMEAGPSTESPLSPTEEVVIM